MLITPGSVFKSVIKQLLHIRLIQVNWIFHCWMIRIHSETQNLKVLTKSEEATDSASSIIA